MSFLSKSPPLMQNQLAVQTLVINASQDTSLFTVDGADIIVQLDEACKKIKGCMVIDDSVPGMVVKPASTLSIVDSEALTAGGDLKAIKIASLTLAANDVLILMYELV